VPSLPVQSKAKVVMGQFLNGPITTCPYKANLAGAPNEKVLAKFFKYYLRLS